MAVGMKMSGVPPDVVPVSLQEAELRVVEDVEVGAAEAVAGRTDQQVPVVLPALPPDGEVEGRPAQLEAGRQERVAQNLQVNTKLYRTASTTEAQKGQTCLDINREPLRLWRPRKANSFCRDPTCSRIFLSNSMRYSVLAARSSVSGSTRTPGSSNPEETKWRLSILNVLFSKSSAFIPENKIHWKSAFQSVTTPCSQRNSEKLAEQKDCISRQPF